MGQVSSSKTQDAANIYTKANGQEWIPDDVLLEIFVRLPGKELLNSHQLVCKRWHSLINSQTVWKMKCERDFGYSKELIHLLAQENFKIIYFKNPYKSNLIKNHDASQEYKHWKILARGGDRFKVENAPAGCDPIEQYIEEHQKKADGPIGCWTTSYGLCSKCQLIDLHKSGVSSIVMDTLKPEIHISEWYASRFDCGCEYRLTVELLGSDQSQVLDKWTFEDVLSAGRSWIKAEHVFKDYKTGVCYIRYHHEGKDTQYWAGWYGVKMTLSSVTLKFA